MRFIALVLFVSNLGVAVPLGCVASAPLGSFQLSVQPPAAKTALPIRSVNIIQAGDKLIYRPGQLPPEIRKKGQIALILAPGEAGALKVLKPRAAGERVEWTAPFRVSVVGLVLGPQGLDEKKVASLVHKDQELISQIADYAQQTSEVESLIQALSDWEQGPSTTQDLGAALNGFASRNGVALAALDKNASSNQQALTLLRAINPALSTYDPLSPSVRAQQSAGLAASVAALFFGNSVGLAAGGAGMVENLRTLLFPNTEFRSALAAPAVTDGITLCAKRQPAKSRTRVAYLWAVRVPNVNHPSLTLAATAHLPLGVKSTVPVKLEKASEAKLLERVRDWSLGSVAAPIKPLSTSPALEIDLTNAKAAPGAYHLAGKWDWGSFEVPGEVDLHPLGDLKTARLTPDSQDRLVAGAGPVTLRLTGADFEFVEKIEFEKQELRFTLPKGKRGGAQDSIDFELNTASLKPGEYLLKLAQSGGGVQQAPIRVLPPNPVIENLPMRVNLGQASEEIQLHGSGLDRVKQIECKMADITLTHEAAVVRLRPGVKKGDRLELLMKVEGRSEPLKVANALVVVGPRPQIVGTTGSAPNELGVALRSGELPAGLFASFSIRIAHASTRPVLRLGCADGQTVKLRPGDKGPTARLEPAGAGNLFLTFDPGAIGQPGCALTAVIETNPEGDSDPASLGRVIRLPRIDSFTLTDEKLGDGAYAGILKGQYLETVEKTGWDAETGLPVPGLPTVEAAKPQEQVLKIALPWPSPAPHAPLFVWLRGEKEGRATSVRY